MLKNFEISAPGKIILNGEHSVVYNKSAIAGPIGLRTFFKLKSTSNDKITFTYKRLDLEVGINLTSVNNLISELMLIPPIDFLHKFRDSKSFILKFVDSQNKSELSEKEQMAVGATLYMLHRILSKENVSALTSAFDVVIDSDMSIGAGVGSSASYGVCLAAGFFVLSKIASKNLKDDFTFDASQLEKISKWAFDSEVIMHEKPSGIDNTICTYGQLIKFKRGQQPVPINTTSTIDILLVDTKVTRSTSLVVGKVAEFRENHPNILDSIFDAMGFVAEDVVKILESEGEKYEKLKPLVSTNNNLLRSIGVSHPRLEKIFVIAESHGFSAKLTGAGAGGCGFVLLPPGYKESESYRKMCEELTADGFEIMATIIGGRGLDIKFQ